MPRGWHPPPSVQLPFLPMWASGTFNDSKPSPTPTGCFGGHQEVTPCRFGRKHRWALRAPRTWQPHPWTQMGAWGVWKRPPWAPSQREVVCPRARGGCSNSRTPPPRHSLPAEAATTHPAQNKSPSDCILLPWGLKNNDFDHLLSKS